MCDEMCFSDDLRKQNTSQIICFVFFFVVFHFLDVVVFGRITINDLWGVCDV